MGGCLPYEQPPADVTLVLQTWRGLISIATPTCTAAEHRTVWAWGVAQGISFGCLSCCTEPFYGRLSTSGGDDAFDLSPSGSAEAPLCSRGPPGTQKACE